MTDYLKGYQQHNQQTNVVDPAQPATDVPMRDPGDNRPEALIRRYLQHNEQMGIGAPGRIFNGASVPKKDPQEVHLEELGGGSFGDPGFPEVGIRADLSLTSNFENQRKKFQSYYPEGKLEKTKDGTLYYKANDADTWHEYDPGPKTKFDANEIAGDFADFAGPAIPAVGEMLATRGLGGKVVRDVAGNIIDRVAPASLKKFMARSAGGAGGGQLFIESEEAGRGLGNSPTEALSNIGQETALAPAGVALTHGLVQSPLNAATGRGLIKTQPNAMEMQEEADALGLRKLMPHQLFDHPFLKRLGQLSQAHSPHIKREYVEQMRVAADKMKAIEDRKIPQELPEIVMDYLNRFRDETMAATIPAIRRPREIGEMAAQAVDRYENLSRAAEMAMYRRANDLAPATFDVSAAQARARRILEGTPVNVTREVESGLLDLNGNPIMRQETVQENAISLSDRARAQLNRIVRLDPILSSTQLSNGQTVPAFEQLVDLRHELLDLKQLNVGELGTKETMWINQLYSDLTDALRPPANPQFAAAWQQANDFARERRDTLEQWTLIKAQKSASVTTDAAGNDTLDVVGAVGPYQMAKYLLRPNAYHHLEAVRRVMSNAEWRQTQDFFKTDLVGSNLDDMAKINRRLDAYRDSDVLGMMLTPAETTAVRQIGTAAEKIKSSGLLKMAERHTETMPMMRDIIDATDPHTVNELLKLKDPQHLIRLDVKLKEGLVDAIAERVIKTDKKIPILDEGEFNNVVKRMEENGSIKFLEGDQQRLLKTLRDYTQFVSSIPQDMGTSQAATETVAGAIKLHHKMFLTMIRYSGIGRMYANGSLTKLLAGYASGGGDRFDLHKMKSIAGAMATLANDPEATGTEAFYKLAQEKKNYLLDKADTVRGKFLD